ncbi:sigma-70 family RNA polymerase sigma factor [Brevibacillus massiliensis]|jgi:RNA polymerase sigma-70 factor (ECF subfamily)|uniref:sigma-70 family RNA polymerase sigma factor n=1 Tax=Brevibacillus massiliensis TaxID=1118054 RepID=UPI000550599A|nr:sigma-70 family RNA polymerase sigma factor [Brevibacillus massiliensis]
MKEGGRRLESAEISLAKTTEAQFEELLKDYLQKVLRLVYSIVKDRNLAEDITQEVFLKAFRSMPSFRGESSLKTWIYRIAANEAKKHVRSWSFRHLFFRAEVDAGVAEDAQATILKNDQRHQFARLVMRLPGTYRQVIILHYYEELSIEEVAEVLGTTAGGVYTKLHRARKKLKELLEKEGAEWI